MRPKQAPYNRFTQDEMILRDFLAADRTVLANERTFLSYIRTALGLVAVGASSIHFFEGIVTDFVGVLFIVAGLGVAAWGARRYSQYRHRIAHLLEAMQEDIARSQEP